MSRPKKRTNIDYFDNNQRASDIKGRALQAGAITFISKILTTTVHIGGVAVLGRLLKPDDFGLVAMATVITSIFLVFQDVGLTDATIQASELKHEEISTLFWINGGIGLLITLILSSLSPAIAWFFKKPQLTLITIIASLSFLFWGLAVQHLALLKREMMFLKVNIIHIVAITLGTGMAILLALAGAGYWAIVMRDLISSVTICILTWTLCRWRPGPPKKSPGVLSLIKFGANSVGYYTVNYFANNLDKAIIGKSSGAEQLGYYSRAYYLATTPSSQLTQSLFHVAVSTLSKLREDKDKYRRYYLYAISVISFFGMPMSIFMVVSSKELVLLLLGPQWGRAAELFSILGLAAGINIIYSTNGWLHVSLGRSDRWLKWGIIGSATLSLGFVIGMFFGPEGVAWGYSISIIILTFPGILYAGKPIGLRLRQVWAAIWKPMTAAVIAGLLFSVFKKAIVPDARLFWMMMISLAIYGTAYLLVFIAISRGIAPLLEYLSLVKTLLPKGILKRKAQ